MNNTIQRKTELSDNLGQVPVHKLSRTNIKIGIVIYHSKIAIVKEIIIFTKFPKTIVIISQYYKAKRFSNHIIANKNHFDRARPQSREVCSPIDETIQLMDVFCLFSTCFVYFINSDKALLTTVLIQQIYWQPWINSKLRKFIQIMTSIF